MPECRNGRLPAQAGAGRELLSLLKRYYPNLVREPAPGEAASPRSESAAASIAPLGNSESAPFNRGSPWRFGDNQAVFRTLIDIYFKEYPPHLEAARARAEPAEIRRAAHTLKGMLATLAAQPATPRPACSRRPPPAIEPRSN